MLSIDGVHIENDLGLHLLQGSNEPILPDTRDNKLTIPERHGSYAFDSYIAERRFFQEILIPTQADIGDVQVITRKISELLLDEYGKPKEVKLVWDYEPDKYYIAKFSGYIAINRIHHAGTFPIPFTAYDPWAYSEVYGDEVYWGSEEITFESHYLLGHDGIIGEQHITSPTTFNVVSNGYAVQPIFEINGTANDLTISTNGKSFSLPNFSNSEYVLYPQRYLTEKDGVNAFGDKTGDWLTLLPGDNDVQVTGTNLDIDIRIKFRDRYM